MSVFPQEITSERLSSRIKSGAVENYTTRGYTPNGNEKAMDILYRTWADRKLGLSGNEYKRSPDGFTRVGLVPLSSPIISKDIREEFSPQDVAVCVAYYGEKMDEYKRSGVLRSVIILSKEDAALFIEKVKKNPGLVYDMVRQVNGGPIKKYDGSPADIKPGKAVEILANNSVGGNINQTTKTEPFKESFNPNSLF